MNQIHVFDAANPGTITKTLNISGITPASNIVGMDFRPATGQLYVLGYLNVVVKTAQLYTIDTATGLATTVGSPLLNFPIDGQVAFDFNPTVDRIRVETSNGLNYRLHPTTGAIAATDSTLRFGSTDVNAGISPNIGACAYINSFIASTSTQLFVYDDSLNVFGLQNPPNNGVVNTLFSSGISVNPADPTSDFDFWFDKVSGTNKGFFIANTGGSATDSLYTINLTLGSITPVGAIGTGAGYKDIAVLIDRKAPTSSGYLTYGITSNNNLISFHTGTSDYIISAVALSGVTSGYAIKGTDFRPATGELYAIAYNSALMLSKLYTINRTTALATQVGDSINIDLSGEVNFDFNPTVDRIRVSTSANKNYRLHPVTGAIAATDANLNFNATDVNTGKDPFVTAAAYTNSYIASSATTLYVIDDSLSILATQVPPNNGTLNTIGSTGLTANFADASSDLDIIFDTTNYTNQAFLTANASGSTFDKLYSLNLSSGGATLIGNIGYGVAVSDIALFIDRTAPAMTGQQVYAFNAANQLLSFYTGNPTYIRSAVAVTGLPSGYDIVGSDFRNNGGLLHVLAYNTGTQSAKIFTINEATAVLTAVSADSITPIDLSGRVGVDFNPTVDRLRVVTSNNKNFRMHPATGLLVAPDSDENYAMGDVNNGKDPNIGSVAYSNARIGAATTVMYAYDDSLNILANQTPPNAGTLNTIGSSGIVQSTATQTSDLDIYYDPTNMVDMAYLTADVTAGADVLYNVNLSTGAATQIGRIGLGISVKDIAVKPAPSSVNILERSYAGSKPALLVPNPATQQTSLRFNLESDQNVTVVILDMSGRKVQSLSTRASKGDNGINLNVADLDSGIYLITIETESSDKFTARLVK